MASTTTPTPPLTPPPAQPPGRQPGSTAAWAKDAAERAVRAFLVGFAAALTAGSFTNLATWKAAVLAGIASIGSLLLSSAAKLVGSPATASFLPPAADAAVLSGAAALIARAEEMLAPLVDRLVAAVGAQAAAGAAPAPSNLSATLASAWSPPSPPAVHVHVHLHDGTADRFDVAGVEPVGEIGAPAPTPDAAATGQTYLACDAVYPDEPDVLCDRPADHTVPGEATADNPHRGAAPNGVQIEWWADDAPPADNDSHAAYVGYDEGGALPPGVTVAANETASPEPSLPAEAPQAPQTATARLRAAISDAIAP